MFFPTGGGWSDRQRGRLSFHVIMLRNSNGMEGKWLWGKERVAGVDSSKKFHGAGEGLVTLSETWL